MSETKLKRVLIIDRLPFWRDNVAFALEKQGYEVQVSDSYDYELEASDSYDASNLIILGCPRLGRAERDLINRILASHRQLVVFCSSLPWGDMRTLFIAGAADVADKPYDAAQVVTVVQEVFTNMAEVNTRNHPHVGAQ